MSILIKLWAPDGHGLSENLVSKAVLTASNKKDQRMLATFIAAFNKFSQMGGEELDDAGKVEE